MAHLQEMSLNRRLFFLFFEGRRSSITGVASFGGVGGGGGFSGEVQTLLIYLSRDGLQSKQMNPSLQQSFHSGPVPVHKFLQYEKLCSQIFY